MKFKKLLSLLAGIAFIFGLTVCPAFAASDDIYGGDSYVGVQKDHNLISGTIDYLGSVVDVFSKGTWETFDSATAILPQKCPCPSDRDYVYKPVITMNRGARWTRSYRR